LGVKNLATNASTLSRRGFSGVMLAALWARPARTYTLHAIAAALMPDTRTIRCNDPRFAEHFAKGGIFEIRDYASGPEVILHDSLETRWRSAVAQDESPTAISLYRPA
jgi:hypothetical protein